MSLSIDLDPTCRLNLEFWTKYGFQCEVYNGEVGRVMLSGVNSPQKPTNLNFTYHPILMKSSKLMYKDEISKMRNVCHFQFGWATRTEFSFFLSNKIIFPDNNFLPPMQNFPGIWSKTVSKM